jgi:hypothetical protein
LLNFSILLHPAGQRPYSYSRTDCFCLGPLQAIFTMAAVNRGRTETHTLVTNKADSISLLRMLNKVRGLMDGGAEGPPRAKKGKKQPIATSLSLFVEFDASRMPLPPVVRKLKANQVDILFNRAKVESGNVLSYAEFLDCLRFIADGQYLAEKIIEVEEEVEGGGEVGGEGGAERGATEGGEATAAATAGEVGVNPVALLAPIDTSASIAAAGPSVKEGGPVPATPASATASTPLFASTRGGKHPTHKTHKSLEGAAHKLARGGARHRQHVLTIAKLKCSSEDKFQGPAPDHLLALVLNLVSSLRHEEWMAAVLEWLHRESNARVALFVTRIQCLLRRVLAGKRIAAQRKHKSLWLEQATLGRQATLVQSLCRMYIGRFQHARRAQRLLIQYCPHFGEPYWYNPHTQVKSWTKPKGTIFPSFF